MTEGLSDIQRRILQVIQDYIQRNGRPPTNREIGAAVNVHSTGHIDYHLSKLEEKGYIVREKAKSRAIRLVKRGLPIRGTIAAGKPLNIFDSGEQDLLDIDAALYSRDAYVLRVQGLSMIEDYIFDGDWVIIEPDTYINNGDVIVATHERGDEVESERGAATLKRFYKEGQQVRLQPANSTMAPYYVDADKWDKEWRIQGKVRAVIRRY
jgi:repressor LexA